MNEQDRIEEKINNMQTVFQPLDESTLLFNLLGSQESISKLPHTISTINEKNNELEQINKEIAGFPMLIYESYNPTTLESVKEYIDFVLKKRSIMANEIDELDSETIETESAEDIPRKPDYLYSSLIENSTNPKSKLEAYLSQAAKSKVF